MADQSDLNTPSILAQLLENENRYTHRAEQLEVLQSEMVELRAQSDSLMRYLQDIWAQRYANLLASQRTDHRDFVKLQNQLHSLYAQARISRQGLPIDTSSRRVLDNIIQQLADLHREATSHLTIIGPPAECLRMAEEGRRITPGSNNRNEQPSTPVRPTGLSSGKSQSWSRLGREYIRPTPITAIGSSRSQGSSAVSRAKSIKTEKSAHQAEQLVPTPLEAQLIEAQNDDSPVDEDKNLWWSDTPRTSIESV